MKKIPTNWIMIAGFALIIGGWWWFYVDDIKPSLNGKACTQEAKLCPDGSSVGRVGPNCDFAKCPGENSIDISNWKTYRNEEYGFEVKYPDKWGASDKITEGILSYVPEEDPVSLYTQRSVSEQGPISAPVTISIYQKPLGKTIYEWLSTNFGGDITKVKSGGIQAAVNRAKEKEEGLFSFQNIQQGNIIKYELGAVNTGGAFVYATFITRNNYPYIIELSFVLQYFGAEDLKVMPSDKEYIDIYNQILSTFKFIEPQKNLDSAEKTCVSDAGCKGGFSCWYQTPRGPFAGVSGSKENPGKCWDNKTLQQIY